MNKANTASKRVGVGRLLLRSMVCAFGGWCVLIAYVHLHYFFSARWAAEESRARFAQMGMEGWEPQRSALAWLFMPAAITQFSLPCVAGVWLLIVLPFFVFIKPSSWLWRWPVTVLGFGTAGALMMQCAIQVQLMPIVPAFVGFAALTGAATGLFCSIAKRRQHREENAGL